MPVCSFALQAENCFIRGVTALKYSKYHDTHFLLTASSFAQPSWRQDYINSKLLASLVLVSLCPCRMQKYNTSYRLITNITLVNL